MSHNILLSLGVAALASLTGLAAADDTYDVVKVLIPDDEPALEGLSPTQVYKPHEVAVGGRLLWVSSNEREGFAGITLFKKRDDSVIANLNIEEPGVTFTEEAEEETIGNTEEEDTPEPNFDPEIRFDPEVCLPVRLYPGSEPPVYVEVDENGVEVSYSVPLWENNPNYICAPLGAESHARHPHGIDIDKTRRLVYQVIEHSGLKWNIDRTGFEVAETTDEESGLLLAYDISEPASPEIVDGFLLGHGAHEVAVNERNGKVFQGNHEDSPGVEPNIWVDVIDRALANPYGFIDTGFYNAIQGIEVDEKLGVVFGTTHVGETMFALDASCVPEANDPPTVVDYNLDPDVEEPFIEKEFGENCILYTVDLRAPFLEQVPGAEEILARADTELAEALAAGEDPSVLPSVLHMHDLTVDPTEHRAYQTLHSIHHAEHTGSPEEAALPDEAEAEEPTPPDATEPGGETAPPPEEVEPEHHVMGRWVAEVDVSPDSDTFKEVRYIDLSNGQDALTVPSSEAIPEGTPFDEQFVHAHWVAVDPEREVLFVTGEHTGNLAILETEEDLDEEIDLDQVIGISLRIPECQPELDEAGNPEIEEPHVHGVQVDRARGSVYVSDEGEHCFYESVTILRPADDEDERDDDERDDDERDDD